MGFWSKTVRSTHRMNERVPTGETGRNLTQASSGYVIRKPRSKPVKAHKREK